MKGHSTNKVSQYRIIGVMSGTSLDGLDLAACTFYEENGSFSFEINEAKTIEYPKFWTQKLIEAKSLDHEDLNKLHDQYGLFIGEAVKNFADAIGFKAELVASHGHTIFHQPDKGFTVQIGNGEYIADTSGITTISDFRSKDVALGGQGAPLVPIGDRDLFAEYDYCLNLGGFANISFEKKKQRIAFDICPVNIVLNKLAQKLGVPFDKDGQMGRQGIINESLLDQLNQLDFYWKESPKSLGREWVENIFYPILLNFNDSEMNIIRTMYEHIAIQIAKVIEKEGSIFITGGGANNRFLIERIKKYRKSEIVIPETAIVDFKEALIFAYLGLLRFQNKVNCLSSVTGAKVDSCGGVIHVAT